MNEQEKIGSGNDANRERTDEIGNELESGTEVNAAIEQQGVDAAAGIPRATDAAQHEQEKQPDEPEDDNRELTGAP